MIEKSSMRFEVTLQFFMASYARSLVHTPSILSLLSPVCVCRHLPILDLWLCNRKRQRNVTKHHSIATAFDGKSRISLNGQLKKLYLPRQLPSLFPYHKDQLYHLITFITPLLPLALYFYFHFSEMMMKIRKNTKTNAIAVIFLYVSFVHSLGYQLSLSYEYIDILRYRYLERKSRLSYSTFEMYKFELFLGRSMGSYLWP